MRGTVYEKIVIKKAREVRIDQGLFVEKYEREGFENVVMKKRAVLSKGKGSS